MAALNEPGITGLKAIYTTPEQTRMSLVFESAKMAQTYRRLIQIIQAHTPGGMPLTELSQKDNLTRYTSTSAPDQNVINYSLELPIMQQETVESVEEFVSKHIQLVPKPLSTIPFGQLFRNVPMRVVQVKYI